MIAITTIYVEVLCWAILSGPPIMDVVNYEIVYNEMWINILIYCTAPTGLFFAPATFYYFGIKSREESRANSNRSIWFGTGVVFFDIAYILEVAPFFPSELSIPFRSFFLVAAIIMYFCFTKEWTD